MSNVVLRAASSGYFLSTMENGGGRVTFSVEYFVSSQLEPLSLLSSGTSYGLGVSISKECHQKRNSDQMF